MFMETTMSENPKMNRADLRNVATYQRMILVCILAYIILVILNFVLPTSLQLVIWIVAIGLSLTATVCVFLLATKVYSTGLGVLLAILTLVPIIGLIVLLIINGKATSVLRAHDIPVGFLGADLSKLQ
jgi:hypothetical protein